MRGSIAPQLRLLAENRSVDTLRLTQGTPVPIWPGEAAVLATPKNGVAPHLLGPVGSWEARSCWTRLGPAGSRLGPVGYCRALLGPRDPEPKVLLGPGRVPEGPRSGG